MALSTDGEKFYFMTSFEKGYDLWELDVREKSMKVLKKLGQGGAQLQVKGDNIFVLSGGNLQKVDKGGKSTSIKYDATMRLDLAEERDICLAGWEDIAKGLEPETQERLKRSLYFINVWNTDGVEGFPVVLSPAAYTYLDLAYSDSPDEIGLHWAGYVDERKTFALQPKDYKGDIIGVQAQLWSSQLRSFDDATYQMLPKGLGVAERGWNVEATEPFETAFGRFYSIVVAREMPVWEQKGFTFKKR